VIHTIKLKFGSAPGQAPVQLVVAPVTVFVGPNNAGKSKVLKEINRNCTSGIPHPSDVILESVTYDEFPEEKIPEITRGLTLPPHTNEAINPGHIIVGRHRRRHQVRQNEFDAAFEIPTRIRSASAGGFLRCTR
jgi:ABC-type branched-subunit amino acid transport system ATPase component